MTSIRHIAMACVTGAALSFGVVGCQPEQKPDIIPANAQLMDSGNGTILYTAPDNGMVYIYDHQQNKLVWSGNVMKGQGLQVDPTKNEVMSNGAVVTMKTLNTGDTNDIYFVAAPTPAPAPGPAPAPVPAPPVNPPANSNSGNSYNGGLTVTPSVTVQPSNGGQPAGSLTVQPGLNVAPTTQPSAQ